jgi:cysteine desulfurase/selenocysteine lyase
VYLDSAATALAPRAVIEAVATYHVRDAGGPHRAVHERSRRATAAYEGARARVARFLCGDADEVVFVRGTTEAINLVAQAWARPRLGPGDEVVVTEL